METASNLTSATSIAGLSFFDDDDDDDEVPGSSDVNANVFVKSSDTYKYTPDTGHYCEDSRDRQYSM